MRRSHVLVLAAIVLAAVGLAVFFLGGDPEETATTTKTVATKPAPAATAPAEQDRGGGPMPMPRFSADDDPAGPLRLEGQVLGPDGEPMGGAKVWVSSVPRRDTISEQDGSFAFDKLLGRSYALTARSGDLNGQATVKLTATTDPVVIRLRRAATLTVTVKGDGKPLAGATVTREGQDQETLTTDDAGKVVFHGVDDWASVTAKASGFAPASTLTSVRMPGRDIELELQRGAALSGRVVDERRRPIAEAKVSVEAGGGDFFGGGDLESNQFVSNKNGEFTIPAVAAGSVRLTARHPELAPATSPILTVDGKTAQTGIELVMKEGATIAGRVVTSDQQPAAFATVQLAPKDLDAAAGWSGGGAFRSATSDDKGEFELRGLPRIPTRVRATSEAASSAVADVDLTATGSAHHLVLVLDVTGTIAGVVVDEQGAPLAEVQVSCAIDVFAGGDLGLAVLGGNSSTTTGGDGRFTLAGLAAGKYRLSASRGSRNEWMWGQQTTSAAVGDSNVKLVLSTPGSIKGKVAFSDGSVPSAAVVRIAWGTPTVVQKGEFVIEEVAPGSHDLKVQGLEFAPTTRAGAVVKSGEVTDVGTITLHRGRRVTGRVLDGHGSPVAGAKVVFGDGFAADGRSVGGSFANVESDYRIRTATSGDDGGFAIVGIGEKEAVIIAEHDERGRSSPAMVPAGQADPAPIELRLKAFGSLEGMITAAKKPVGGATIQIFEPGGRYAIVVRSGDDGSFVVERIPQGSYQILVEVGSMGLGGQGTQAQATIDAGKRAKVTIDIPVGEVELTVAIKPQDAARPIKSAQVLLFKGNLVAKNAKELEKVVTEGKATLLGMQFWNSGPPVTFKKLVPGETTVCTVPLDGDLTDTGFMARVNEHRDSLDIHCAGVTIKDTPAQQTFVHTVPAMSPLPEAAK